MGNLPFEIAMLANGWVGEKLVLRTFCRSEKEQALKTR